MCIFGHSPELSLSRNAPIYVPPLRGVVKMTETTVPPWLLQRMNNLIHKKPSPYESSFYGPLGTLFSEYFRPIDGFMVKSQPRIRMNYHGDDGDEQKGRSEDADADSEDYWYMDEVEALLAESSGESNGEGDDESDAGNISRDSSEAVLHLLADKATGLEDERNGETDGDASESNENNVFHDDSEIVLNLLADTTTDSMGQTVTKKMKKLDTGTPDFIICQGSSDLQSDVPVLLAEVKRNTATRSSAMTQIHRYVSILMGKPNATHVVALLILGAETWEYTWNAVEKQWTHDDVRVVTGDEDFRKILQREADKNRRLPSQIS
ncbi:hypothetical protein PUNSTDRAFT_41893 [Punctularia strigosozonata HHB-11173 SS5]|uniref:uncharacterized protein n=1 Tax=Punctularia strigosozonata (strain HHB-11173) TaxID=741275 RepID=UPI000441777B|nr:uncharacterized protein PUNSTDRAFT_41893 [Punctularia strigosozonata HHB-11173 SS5]EIN12152.1 hypothetical protein PUNSTDRAFT_41893 [Punctularia strigosozonata HHB-11173 SS5]